MPERKPFKRRRDLLTSSEASVCGLMAPLFLGQSEVKSSQQKDGRVENVHLMVAGNGRESKARDKTVLTGCKVHLTVRYRSNV